MTALLDTLHTRSLAGTVLKCESAACSACSSRCGKQTANALHLSAAYYCPIPNIVGMQWLVLQMKITV